MAHKTKRIQSQSGFVTYLRTSDAEVQAPERSQAPAKLADISNSALSAYDYISTLAKTIFQNLQWNFCGLKNNTRTVKVTTTWSIFTCFHGPLRSFSDRDDVELYQGFDQLFWLDINVRFASHPDLNPADSYDRAHLNILFGMAKRESAVLGKRTTGGMLSKLLRE